MIGRLLALALILAVPAPALAQDPEANKAVVRRFIDEVLARGNVDVMDETHHKDAFLAGPGRPGGRDANKALNARFHEVMDDVEVRIDEMVAERDLVMGRFSLEATYLGGLEGVPASTVGKRVGWDGYFQYRLQEGRIVENLWLRNEPAYERSMGID
jgi:predicted ester cyclase